MKQVSRLGSGRYTRPGVPRWMVALLLLAVLAACGGGNSNNPGGGVGSNQGNNWDVGRWDEARWE